MANENKTQLQTNNTALASLTDRVLAAKDTAAALPDAGSGGGELMYLNNGYITLCEKGMTWGEFIESQYNYLQTASVVGRRFDYTSEGYIYQRPYSYYLHVSVDGTASGRVKASDKIIENHVYSMYDDD